MEPSDEHEKVSSGALLAALKLIEITGGGAGSPGPDEAGLLVEVWGVPTLAQAFGMLIFGAMSVVRPGDGDPDHMHLMVPAVVTRLCDEQWARPFLPTMAGVLTACAAGDDAWQWRESLGPVGRQELTAWWHTAYLVADLVDNVMLGKPGAFVQMASRMVTDAEDGLADPGPESGWDR